MKQQRTPKSLLAATLLTAGFGGSLLLMAVARPTTQAVIDASLAAAPEQASEFSSATIDLGVVVRDLEKSVAFYTKLIGFTQVPGFSVDAAFCGGAGLTDDKALDVSVLVLRQSSTVVQC